MIKNALLVLKRVEELSQSWSNTDTNAKAKKVYAKGQLLSLLNIAVKDNM